MDVGQQSSPYKEEIPATCKLKILKSTAVPKWKPESDKGGYQICWLLQINLTSPSK